jgi:predicted enzyme related to lactoylglutathione lyase
MEDPMHGFGHISIPTTNLKKAKKFFGKVFGWTFKDYLDMNYVLFWAGEPPNGGFYLVKKMPKKAQVNVFIEVEDIDAKLKEIKKAKGKVLMKKTAVADMGWMGEFATPDGCFLSLWQEREKAVAPAEGSATPGA